jgi:uncharacterized protein (DUF1330 family)
MTTYLIVQTFVSDPGGMEEYKRLAFDAVHKYGGKYLSRGGAMESLEGQWDVPRVVLLEFPSAERAKEFYNSPDYTAARKAREGKAHFVMTLLEAT